MKKILFFVFCSINTIAQTISFDAKGIIYLQDSDFGTFSFSSGTIEKDKSSTDKMGAFLFPLMFEDSYSNSEQAVSNSIFDNSKSIVLRSDNRVCYILETRGGIKKEDNSKSVSLKNLPDGGYVSVVDIANLRNLQPDYRFPVALNPKAIALNKTNEYLAVAAEGYNQELQVFELNEFGKPIRLIQKPTALANGAINDVIWHPSEDFLAYLKADTKEIGLLRVVRDGPTKKIIRLELLGNTIKLDGMPKAGYFTKDGKYFIVLDSKEKVQTISNNLKGQVFAIKFNYEDQGVHALISKAEVEENPNNIVLSPDGNSILVTNIKRSFDYPINEKNTGKSSLSVLTLSNDGTLTNKQNIALDGIMPLGLAFDKSGKNIAISFFQFLNYGKPSGGIEFFKFSGGSNPKIERQGARINMAKGVHSLKVIEDY